MILARPAWRRFLGAAIALTAAALALAAAAVPAGAVTPTCSAVLFMPVDETGAYMVEQPESAPGAIFCQPFLGSLEFGVASAPAHGTIEALEPNGLGGATFSYAPAPGSAGEDSFTLSARDGADEPATVRVEVRVRPAGNDAPVCVAQLAADGDGDGYVVEAGAPVAGSIDCFDDEGDELTFAIQDGPEHGTLGGIESDGAAAASFTYTPSPGFQGADRFALTASDGTQDSLPMEVEVTVVAAVDDPPRCGVTLATTSDADGNYEVEQGETVHGAVTCVDEEAGALGFELAAPPDHGAVAPLSPSGDGGVDVAYTPLPAHLGFDSFQIDVSDGAHPAVPVTVRVRVVAARDDPPACTVHLLAPIAGGAHRVGQGTTVGGQLACEDDEGAPLEYAVAAPPQHGSVSPADEDGRFTYTAPAAYLGAEEIAFLASDGDLDSQPAVVEIEVVAAEEPPPCEVALGAGTNAADEYLVERDGEAQGRIACGEAGTDLDLTVAAAPAHGSIEAFEEDGPGSAAFTYVPAPGYLGPDAFTLAASDGGTSPRPVTVSVRVVEPSPHAPHCQGRLRTPSSEAGYEVESGETVTGTLTCFDADGDDLSFSVAEAPGHGSVAGLETAAAGVARFTYAADASWAGPDGFALVASDGVLGSDVIEIDVQVVTPVDDPPVCSASLFSEKLVSGAYPAEEGEANAGTVICTDDEGEPLTFSVGEEPQHGAIAGLRPEGDSAFFDYEADAGYAGPDAATFSARDPAGSEDLIALALDVGPAVNTAPTCTATLSAPLSAGIYSVKAGTPVAGEISCVDAELDSLSFSVVQAPARGTLSSLGGSGASRSFTYTAASGQSGPDQFSLKANDGRADSATVAVALQVQAAGGTTPGGNGPAGPAAPALPPVSTPPLSTPPKPKPLRCRKGFKKKKVKGKVKCVRAKAKKGRVRKRR